MIHTRSDGPLYTIADPSHAAAFDAAFGTPDFARAYTAFTSRGRAA